MTPQASPFSDVNRAARRPGLHAAVRAVPLLLLAPVVFSQAFAQSAPQPAGQPATGIAPAAPVGAVVPTGSGGALAPTASGPTAPIVALYEALGRIEQAGGSFADRSQILAPAIDGAFDLATVLRNSLGLRFRTVPEAQKTALLEQFRQFTIARYVSNFAPGGKDGFRVDPAPTASAVAGEQIVHTHITAGSATTDVNYVMRQGAGGWRVVDVLLNGNISQVAVQRADFGSSLGSGDASSLIESLRRKTAAFQRG